MAKDRGKKLALKPNRKSSITYRGKGNSMASPTQTVAGKGIPTSLIAEGLLKILRELNPPIPTRIPYKFSSNSLS